MAIPTLQMVMITVKQLRINLIVAIFTVTTVLLMKKILNKKKTFFTNLRKKTKNLAFTQSESEHAKLMLMSNIAEKKNFLEPALLSSNLKQSLKKI